MHAILPTPESVQGKVVCIRNIKNYPDRCFAYVSVLVDNRVTLLFFRYSHDYTEVVEQLAQTGLPVHYVQFHEGRIAQSLLDACPCTSKYWTHA